MSFNSKLVVMVLLIYKFSIKFLKYLKDLR